MFKQIIEKLNLKNKDNVFFIDPVFKSYNTHFLYHYFLKRNNNKRLIICFSDVDNLKEINDSQGHSAGDKIIQSMVDDLKQFGTVIRVGGDEFVTIVDEDKLEQLKALEHERYSIGIWVKEEKDDLFEAIHKADRDMYNNKQFKKR